MTIFLIRYSYYKRDPCSAPNFSVLTTILISSNFVVINVRIAHFYSNLSTLREDITHMQTVPSIPQCVRFRQSFLE